MWILFLLSLAFFAAPVAVQASCGTSLPFTFTNGLSIVDATTTNTNNSFLLSCASNVDNTQIGSAGIFASQIIPTTVGQATFGGAIGYTFASGATGQTQLTVNAPTGATADILDVNLAGVRKVYVDSTGKLNLATPLGQSSLANGYVDLSSAQTVGGAKTFSAAAAFGSTVQINSTITTGMLNIGNANTGNSGALYIGNQSTATGSIHITQIGTSSGPVAGVTSPIFGVADSSVAWLLALNQTGSLGIAGSLNSSGVNSSAPIQAASSGTVTSYVPPMYGQNGTVVPNTMHSVILPNISLPANTAVTFTFTGAAVFSSQTTYACYGQQFGSTGPPGIQNSSGTAIIVSSNLVNGAGNATVVCTGY